MPRFGLRPGDRASLLVALLAACLGGTLALLSTAPAIAAPAAAASKPNVIVIFCDNLGYGDIEPFGSELHRTPALNRMAAEGRRFTHFCVTAGVCTPSRASLLTGCYSQRVGMHTNPRDGKVLRPLSPYGLHPDEVTVAEVLQEAGYATAIIGKWHLGDAAPFLPTRQGFETFFGIPYSDDMTAEVGRRIGDRLDGNRWPELPLMRGEAVIEAPVDRHQLTRRYTEEAIRFIDQHRQEPFFLYMPQAMPGSTRTPFASPEFQGRSRNGPWGDAIEELDWSTGKILDHLVDRRLAQRTLVIWTSDNGAPLARDPRSPARGSNQPLHGRGYTTAEGAFRVPTLMWWPGMIPPGTTCETLATTMDILPTLAALAGGQTPPDRKIDGHDITDLVLGRGPQQTPYEAFYYYDADTLQAVRQGRWKLFVPLETVSGHPHFEPGEGNRPLLFDVVADVGCAQDVAADHPEVVARLRRLAEAARAELGDQGTPGAGVRPPGFLPQR